MSDRAAQFSPFAALSGYDAAVEETARLTTDRIELAEDAKVALEHKLDLLAGAIQDSPTVTLTYFRPDERKSGGAYVDISGVVKRIDSVTRTIIMKSGAVVALEDILDVDWRRS